MSSLPASGSLAAELEAAAVVEDAHAVAILELDLDCSRGPGSSPPPCRPRLLSRIRRCRLRVKGRHHCRVPPRLFGGEMPGGRVFARVEAPLLTATHRPDLDALWFYRRPEVGEGSLQMELAPDQPVPARLEE